MEGEAGGSVRCGSWIRRPENLNLVVLGRTTTFHSSSSSAIEIFSFDPNANSLSSSPLARHDLEESDDDPIAIAVHPSGDCFVCSTINGGCNKTMERHEEVRNFSILRIVTIWLSKELDEDDDDTHVNTLHEEHEPHGSGINSLGEFPKMGVARLVIYIFENFYRHSAKEGALEGRGHWLYSVPAQSEFLNRKRIDKTLDREAEVGGVGRYGGARLFELHGQGTHLKLSTKELPPLLDAGPQKCLAFSVDGSRFATGGVDGHLRILEWPTLRILVDEVRAHKSFRDMDFSLDSEFLASTSTDGSARIWKTEDGVPLMTLTSNSDEKIELCRFSKDGTKPFLFCTVQRGIKALTAVYDISTWNKIGHKRLLGKPASVMSVSLDGKYLALGSKDGDICVVEVKKMEISHWSKRLHLGTPITSLEFCPSRNCRVVLTTSNQWGAMVTKLNVPADWKGIPLFLSLSNYVTPTRVQISCKEWQIYFLLLGLFLASAVVFYIFFEKSDSFWNFPISREQQTRRNIDSFLGDAQSDDPNVFGPLDM
ncbi:SEC12-like protein 1 [Hibiscus syriacus]|uniref:SEC12-like protein 1 n=1 Tax=Hibiscus syriacus TaxID=106335 RepID=A0A6A2XS80_HIBSY|nr:SEC12-like protein 1 [Hibiscus syriacus]